MKLTRHEKVAARVCYCRCNQRICNTSLPDPVRETNSEIESVGFPMYEETEA